MKSGRLTKAIVTFVAVVICILLGFLLFVSNRNQDDFDQFASEVMTILQNYSEDEVSVEIDKSELQEINGITLINRQTFERKLNAQVDVVGDIIKITKNSDVIEIDVADNVMNVGGDKIAIAGAVTTQNMLSLDMLAEVMGYSVIYTPNEAILIREFATSRLIIKANQVPNELNAVATASGFNDYYIYQFDSPESAKVAYSYYNEQSDVMWVEEDAIFTADETAQVEIMGVTDNFSYQTWGAEDMGVEGYSNYLLTIGQTKLREVVIAVLDTGLDAEHSWFKDRIYAGGKNYSSDADGAVYEYEDGHGHGTHVSGTIVDLTLPNVKVLPIKVLNTEGKGYASSILLGMNYVSELKASGANIYAMNMSLGAVSGVNTADYKSYVEGVDTAYTNNILTVVAAGNDGIDVARVTPANVTKAITVSAVGVTGGTYTRPSWSNYGSYVDIAAPGVDIVSAYPGNFLAKMSGTSMAAPHIAGAIALLYSNPNITYSLSDMERVIITNAIDIGTSGKDAYFGYGLLNIEYAYATMIENVQFSVTESYFDEPFELTLSSISNATIYYTLDGSTPSTSNGDVYTSPITIDKSVVVSAVAYVLNGVDVVQFSRVTSYTYCYMGQDVEDSYEVDEDGVLTKYSGILTEIAIPETINGITVVAIGTNAFSSTLVEKVYLADTITSINIAAFEGCVSLEYIQGRNVEKIEMYAFNGCENLTTLTDVEFPKLTTIGKLAFYHCINLRSITLSEVTFIDDWAFGMDGVTASYINQISFPKVTVIENSAFYGCKKLMSINLPKVQYVCSQAFLDCDVSVVNLPECEYVGNNAFLQNTYITRIVLPKCKIIGAYAFSSTTSRLVELSIDKVQIVCAYAFDGCSTIDSLDLPCVEYIGKYAFNACSGLAEIDIASVQIVGMYAFNSCYNIKVLNLPNVIEIRRNAFAGVVPTEVFISAVAKQIDVPFTNDLSDCVFKVYSGTCADRFVQDNNYAYEYVDEPSLVEYEVIDDYIKITGHKTLTEDYKIPAMIEGKRVEVIGAGAFAGTDVIALDLPYVRVVDNGAFEGCTSLQSINLPVVESIGDNAYFGCSSLNSAKIENVLTIGDNAFGGTALKLLKLSKATIIGERAIGYDSNGDLVEDFVLIGYSLSTAEEYANDNGIEFNAIFRGIKSFYFDYYENNGYTEIYVALVDADATGNLILPSEYEGYKISKIGDGAFANCSFVTGIELPESFETIGDQAFINCTSLERINLENITYIGRGAFRNCYKLESVDLSGLDTIYAEVFYNCESLNYVNAENVTTIGEMAFGYCTDLITIECPNVTHIMAYAFYCCYSLQNIDLQKVTIIGTENNNTTQTISGQVFTNCYELLEIRLPSIVVLGDNLFTGSGVDKVVLNSTFNKYYGTPIKSYIDIYGYSDSLAKNYADVIGNTFVAIDRLAITDDLDLQMQVVQNVDFELQIEAVGYDLKYQWYVSSTSDIANGVKIDGAIDMSSIIDTSLVGIYYYYVEITDWASNMVRSNICEVTVGDMEDYVVITIIQVDNATISPAGQVVLKKGENYTFNISVVVGYYINALLIDGIKVGAAYTYTMTNVQKNHTFSAIISPNTNTIYTIVHWKESLSVTSRYVNGKYYYQDYIETKTGTTNTITQATYLPDTSTQGFEKVEFDQVNISGDGTSKINIYYNRKSYSVSIMTTEGVLYALGADRYKYGEEVTLSAKLKVGYDFVGWAVKQEVEFEENKEECSAVFVMPHKDVEFIAYAAIKILTLKVITTEGGQADIDTISVEYGEQKQVNFVTNVGYKMKSIMLNGEIVPVTNSMLVKMIYDTTIEVVFEKITFNVNISFDDNGYIEAKGIVDNKVDYGGSVVLNILPDEDYEIAEVYINDQQILNVKGNEIAIDDVKTNIDIKVTFREKNKSIFAYDEETGSIIMDKTIIIIIAVVIVLVLSIAIFVGRIVGKANKRL